MSVERVGFNKKIAEAIEEIKQSDIEGCITGSCLLERDFETWNSLPDVDLFTYSTMWMAYAISWLQSKGYEFGQDGSNKSKLQEQQKFIWLMENKQNKSGMTGTVLHTVKLNRDGIIVNVSNKKYKKTVSEVINDFDMSIIMKGYDIQSKFMYDMTGTWGDPNVAHPNMLRKIDVDLLRVAWWVRQWDRVVKYEDRGFDCRPMAVFYIELIDKVKERGNIWTSDNSQELYDKYMEEFDEMRGKISAWLEAKED